MHGVSEIPCFELIFHSHVLELVKKTSSKTCEYNINSKMESHLHNTQVIYLALFATFTNGLKFEKRRAVVFQVNLITFLQSVSILSNFDHMHFIATS